MEEQDFDNPLKTNTLGHFSEEPIPSSTHDFRITSGSKKFVNNSYIDSHNYPTGLQKTQYDEKSSSNPSLTVFFQITKFILRNLRNL